MTLSFEHVNWLAVLVAAVVAFVLGGLWYSPLLFAKAWIRLHKITDEQMKEIQAKGGAGRAYATAFLSNFVVAMVLSLLLGATAASGLGDALCLAGLCWVGFVGTTGLVNTVFSFRPVALFALDGAYQLVYFLVMGVILGAWR
jgi:hypothetical protein